MNKYNRFFLLVYLLQLSLLLKSMNESPVEKMWRGIKGNDLVVMQEAYDDFVANRDNCDIKTFLDHNCNDIWRTNYLLSAVETGHFEATKKLLELKANIEYKDINQSTALMKAAYKKNGQMIELLLNSGADINVTDYIQESALIKNSVYSDDFEIAKLLINCGAIINNKSLNNLTAIDVARIMSHQELAKFLEEQLKIKRALITKEASEYFPKGVDKMIADYVD